jgi:hypothetical protein
VKDKQLKALRNFRKAVEQINKMGFNTTQQKDTTPQP